MYVEIFILQTYDYYAVVRGNKEVYQKWRFWGHLGSDNGIIMLYTKIIKFSTIVICFLNKNFKLKNEAIIFKNN